MWLGQVVGARRMLESQCGMLPYQATFEVAGFTNLLKISSCYCYVVVCLALWIFLVPSIVSEMTFNPDVYSLMFICNITVSI